MLETLTLGKVAKQDFDEHAKLWLPNHSGGRADAKAANSAGAGQSTTERRQSEQIAALKASNLNLKRKAPAGEKGSKGNSKGAKGAKKAKTSGNPVTLDILLNGTALCAGYNKGTCTAATCPNGQKHVCNVRMPSKTKAVACGRNHKSMDCNLCTQR